MRLHSSMIPCLGKPHLLDWVSDRNVLGPVLSVVRRRLVTVRDTGATSLLLQMGEQEVSASPASS